MFSILDHLSKKFTQHQFLYIFDGPYNDNFIFQKNVLPIIVIPKTSNNLRLQYWFNYKIPAILRKRKADVFLSMEGICSLRTKIPQCLLVNDFSFLQFPKHLKNTQTRFYKKFTPAFLAKAKAIATVSEFSKKIIADHYKISAENITVVHPGVDDIFKPLDWEDKEIIKEKYTEGKAYFLFSGNINQRSNTINLLKAFSFFKKRQKSNMMLLIVGNADENLKKELKTYKFREEIKLLEDMDKAKLAKITAAAYAMVYPVFYDDIALPILQAMQCGVPVVTSNTVAFTAVFGEAVLYADPGKYEDIAQKMMLVFKDEDKARMVVQAGNELVQQYKLDKNADLLMQCILKAANS